MKVLGWIFVPYIMILFNWKKISVAKRIVALAWIAFIIISAIAISGSNDQELSNTVASPAPSVAASPSPVQTQAASQTPTPTQEASPSPSARPSETPKPSAEPKLSQTVSDKKYDVVLHFQGNKYPETAAHIRSAIAHGKPAVCTIDREDADEHRKESLAGIPTKKGYDRDEFPMAMCAEGGSGADVAYVESSDNRGSGSWVGNHLEDYSDGTRVLFVIDGGESGSVSSTPKSVVVTPKPTPTPTENTSKSQSTVVYYKNCTAAREAGVTPLHKGDPGYSSKLDRDGDGIACER